MDGQGAQELLQKQWTLWVACFAAPILALVVVVFFVGIGPGPSPRLPTALALGLATLGCVGASFVVPARQVRAAAFTSPVQAVVSAFALANGLCAGAGMLSAWSWAVTGLWPTLLGLPLAAAGALAHSPSKEKNAALLAKLSRKAP